MRNVYVTLLIIVTVGIFTCSFTIGRREQNSLTKVIRYIMYAASLTMVAYGSALLVHSRLAATILYSVYYTVSDVLLLFMLLYTLEFTHICKMGNVPRALVYAAVAVDGIFMLLNVLTERVFVFRCSLVTESDGSFYDVVDRGVLYNYHRAIIHILTLIVVVMLTAKIVRSPAMYRGKYLITLLSLIVIIAVNVVYVLKNLTIDGSVLAYGLMAVTIYYFNVIYVPQGLVEGLLSSSIKNMDDSVFCFDIEGHCVYANSMAYVFFRTEEMAPFEQYYTDWVKGRPLSQIEDATWQEQRKAHESVQYYDVQFKRLSDADGNYVGCFFKMHDETADVQKLAAERFRATRDTLTGIYNREYFYEVATETVQAAEPDTYCMVCSDIKNFKLVNDIFGIRTGDKVLRNIANTLKRLAGPGSVYGRISGDRFAICMPKKRFSPEVFENEIRRIGENSGTSTYHICIHVGVYDIVDKNMEVSVMCDRAYLAIKTIKESLTNTIARYDDAMRASSISEQKVAGEFNTALEEKQFCFYIQPQTSADGKVLGGEALVRWIHPERGVIAPGEFIEILEHTGLICHLDMYVWENACRKLSEWKERGYTDYYISVNISPRDFYFTDVYRVFTRLVKRYDVNPRNLRLEITETAIMSDFTRQLALIDRLREYGFLVEMDDFGSGYSSLNMLKDMIVDTIKVDMGFLRQTEHEERSRVILQSIVSLSKQLGMEVVIEGVETKQQVDFLTAVGCDIFQGYYFARPMPVDEFEQRHLN